MSRKRKTQLNPANYDIMIPRDMTSLSFTKHISPTEFNIIWFLIYSAHREFMMKFKKDWLVWIDTNKPKQDVIKVLNQLEYTFDMNELKAFCSNSNMVRRELNTITSINAKTNTFMIDYLPLTIQESDPMNISLITSLNGKTGVFTVCNETMYKMLRLPRTNYDIVSLICTADLKTVKSKVLYHLLCTYKHVHMIKGKTIQQWIATINLKPRRQNHDYNNFLCNHLNKMILDIEKNTNFIVDRVVRKDKDNKITITYKGSH